MAAEDFEVFRPKDHSFFRLVEELIPDVGQQRPLQQICSLMRKAGSDFMLRENNVETRSYFKKHYPAVYDEIRHLHKFVAALRCSVTQLSFFDGPILLRNCRRRTYVAKATDRGILLGTCLVLHVSGFTGNSPRRRHISSDFVFEAVITEPSLRRKGKHRVPLLNHHLHIYDEASVIVFGKRRKMFASYFCQQNRISSSCSHSATKVVHWHQQEDKYQLATAEINDALPINTAAARRPAGGFSLEHYPRILQMCGLSMLTTKFEGDTNAQISPFELAYSFVESAFPSLIFFRVLDETAAANPKRKAHYHVVPVVGHTMNTDAWLPTALRTYPEIPDRNLIAHHKGYLSSIEWVPQLIIHDDLMGPYMKICPNSLTPNGLSRDYRGRACFVSAIVPETLGSNWSPLVAQETGAIAMREYFEVLRKSRKPDDKSNEWLRRLEKRWHNPNLMGRDLIARTQLIREPQKYLDKLREERDFFGNKPRISKRLNTSLCAAMPHGKPVWLVEFSIPELYCTNLSKIGEIILPFEAATDDITEQCGNDSIPAPLLFRLFGACRVLTDNNYVDYSIGLVSHTTIYRTRVPPETY